MYPLALITAIVLCMASACTALNCAYYNGICRPSNEYTASLKGSTNPLDTYLTSQATKGLACNSHSSAASCTSDTANACAWDPASSPACDTSIPEAQAAECFPNSTGSPLCNLLNGISIYCITSNASTKADCEVKIACAFVDNACVIDTSRTYLVAMSVARAQGSAYASSILSVYAQCSAVNSSMACVTSRGNGAGRAAVAAAGGLLPALLSLLLLLVFVA